MSAAVCGKRPLFEDYYGSPSNVKRIRWDTSSVRFPVDTISGVGVGEISQDHHFLGDPLEEQLAHLQDICASRDGQLLEEVLASSDHDLPSAIERVEEVCLDFERRQSACLGVADYPSTSQSASLETRKKDAMKMQKDGSIAIDDGEWVELVVHEMSSASNMCDVRTRATRVLEAFEKAMSAQFERSVGALRKENAEMKEQLEVFLQHNHVLKRAVAIQHERRRGEQENRLREVEHLKQLLSHQQEHMKTLELNNYALNVHLRMFQTGSASAVMGRFHPDVF